MIINGIDLSGLAHEAPKIDIPDPVQGRVVHIDADFLAYQVSYERPDDPKTFDDMKHNAEKAAKTIQALGAGTALHLHLTPATSNKGGRYDIAKLKPYQANRQDKAKPRYLHMMRQFLADRFPSTMHQNCEADDGMSSEQYAAINRGDRALSIIASKDKDLSMVPGLHLDWDTGQIEDTGDDFGWITYNKDKKKVVGLGQKFFWAQMLMGDTADNISGLPRVGTKKVGPVLASNLLDGIQNNKEAFTLVKSLYKDCTVYPEGVTWQEAFVSEAQLLWMRIDKHNPKCVINWWRSSCV